jgi:hypothetical protein
MGSALAAAPTVSSASVSAVTRSAAVLEAEINPNGEATTYHFEYGTLDCSSSACLSVPVPNGNLGSGGSSLKIAEEVDGLAPDTRYHYRVVAGNGSGSDASLDRTFRTYQIETPDTSCPNQEFRVGVAAKLPDCRAYEMVSPVEKNGRAIRQFAGLNTGASPVRAGYNQSTPGGDKLAYAAAVSFGDQVSARNANQYIATRGADGWSTHGINPLAGPTIAHPIISFTADFETPFKLFTPDLSSAWIVDQSLTPLTPDAAKGWANLYRRDNSAESFEALTTNVLSNPAEYELLETSEAGLEVQGHSSDFSHIVFSEDVALTPDADPGHANQLYDFSDGETHLVSVLPDGTASTKTSTAGTVLGFGEHSASLNNAVSDDGSRIFWTGDLIRLAGLGAGPLYVRENPDQPQSALNGSNECTEPAKACTLPISSSSERAVFWTANGAGSKVIYSEGALNGALATLFERDVDAEASTPIAGEVSGVLGASDDLSYLYFTSKEDLAAGATAGEPNVYLDHEGTLTFVATLSLEDTGSPSFPAPGEYARVDNVMSRYHASRVTPDGRHLAFETIHPQPDYDNADALNGNADMEVYIYDADSGELTCASCNPSGARPVGQALQQSYASSKEPTGIWAAAWLPTFSHDLYGPRALSEGGDRLYFNSFDALVPRDTNGAQDVYQWEAQGTGSCEVVGGCVSLLSTGEDAEKSEFVDATSDGSTVFIETDSSIAPQDPALTDIYAVREGGGFPPPPPPPPPCTGDSCQSTGLAPNDPTPASASFKGAGGAAARRCSGAATNAGKLNRQAKLLRRRARHASSPQRSKQLRERSARLAKQARETSKQASRCRRSNRGAGR